MLLYFYKDQIKPDAYDVLWKFGMHMEHTSTSRHTKALLVFLTFTRSQTLEGKLSV